MKASIFTEDTQGINEVNEEVLFARMMMVAFTAALIAIIFYFIKDSYTYKAICSVGYTVSFLVVGGAYFISSKLRERVESNPVLKDVVCLHGMFYLAMLFTF